MRADALVNLLIEGAIWSFPWAENKDGADRLLQAAGYSPSPDAAMFDRWWPRVRDMTMLDRFRAESLFTYAVSCLHLDGDLIELGACNGGISLLLALLAREHGGKKVHICDSFQGLPRPDPLRDGQYKQGDYKGDVQALRARIREMALEDVCVIHAGWFEETLPWIPDVTRFCFAHVDCDLYQPVQVCLRFLQTRMPQGAAIMLDDYYDGHGGAMDALEEHVATTHQVIEVGPAPQATVRMGVTAQQAPTLGFRNVQNLCSYRAFLTELAVRHPPNPLARAFLDRCLGDP